MKASYVEAFLWRLHCHQTCHQSISSCARPSVSSERGYRVYRYSACGLETLTKLLSRLQAASLRLGSQGLKTSFDDHLLIIGDAAGHIDPLTGEGIHTAIMARC